MTLESSGIILSNLGSDYFPRLCCLCPESGQAITSENDRGINLSNEDQIYSKNYAYIFWANLKRNSINQMLCYCWCGSSLFGIPGPVLILFLRVFVGWCSLVASLLNAALDLPHLSPELSCKGHVIFYFLS